MIMGGRHPFKGIFTDKKTLNQSVEDYYIGKFKETWNQTKKNLEEAAKRMKQQHDKHVKPSQQYKPRDQVYLDATNVRMTHASKKLNAKLVSQTLQDLIHGWKVCLQIRITSWMDHP